MSLATTTALVGCVPGTSPSGTTEGGSIFAASPVSVERDVEAPNVFNMTGAGLWDGRPSLGGVWVAHTDVKDPERVMIRNTKNGKSVVGALFRRERDNPGPALQVSSDAAEALGMLAGQPADLSVVALKREEAAVPADAEIGPETEDGVVAAGTEAAPGDAPAAAAAPAVSVAAPTPEDLPATDTVSDATADLAVGEPDAAPPAAEPLPAKKRSLFGFLRKKPKNDPLSAIPAQDAGIASAAGTGTIEQAPLEPLTGSAAAAIDRAEASSAPAAAPAAAPSALKRAYVQIGIFSTEANANRAASQMRAAGMSAEVKTDQSNGKTYWRVIVGPAASEADRNALAAKVKGIGYPDAYPVSK
ncbi:MAG: SPOR domain-containing protein [Rhodobacteraceae bacterium]|nr:SPOR domain-containing protein [Paracoccaceae bacterium]